MSERWLPVPSYEGLYEVSDLGRIRSMRRGALMSPGSGEDGYPIVSLYGPDIRRGRRWRSVHESAVPQGCAQTPPDPSTIAELMP